VDVDVVAGDAEEEDDEVAGALVFFFAAFGAAEGFGELATLAGVGSGSVMPAVTSVAGGIAVGAGSVEAGWTCATGSGVGVLFRLTAKYATPEARIAPAANVTIIFTGPSMDVALSYRNVRSGVAVSAEQLL